MRKTRRGNFMSLIDKITAELEAEAAGIERFRSIVGVDLNFMQDAVNGVYDGDRKEIETSLDRVIAFYKRRVGGTKLSFPDTFWTDGSTREVATLISLTWKWLMGDDLIRFSEAAAMLRGIDPGEYSKNDQSGVRHYMHNLT